MPSHACIKVYSDKEPSTSQTQSQFFFENHKENIQKNSNHLNENKKNDRKLFILTHVKRHVKRFQFELSNHSHIAIQSLESSVGEFDEDGA